MQSVSFRIWTRVTVSISYDDNQYTTGTSDIICSGTIWILVEYLDLATFNNQGKDVCFCLSSNIN